MRHRDTEEQRRVFFTPLYLCVSVSNLLNPHI